MSKNLYMAQDDRITFRRATKDDNFEEIAELIYCTDQYIYPFGLEVLKIVKKFYQKKC